MQAKDLLMNDDAVSSYTSSLKRGSSPPLTKLESYSENESIVQPGALVYTLPTQLEGELEWGKFLAYGGYSEVHRGTWIRPGGDAVPVAIKRIRRTHLGSDKDENDRFERRIKREVVVWQTSKHANILEFYGFKIDEHGPLFVSPLCENGNLGEYTRNNTKLTDAEKLNLLHDAAQGLDHLHLLKPPIIHGDVKPENIIIANDIKGVLCDFGISMVITGLGIRTGLTSEGQGSGSPGFQAVELLRGLSPTLWCDVYAFGGVILATMSGQRPFHQLQGNPRAIDNAVYEGKTPTPFDHPGLPEADTLWQLLKDCWSAEPNQRPRMNIVGDLLLGEIQHRSPSVISPARIQVNDWYSFVPPSSSLQSIRSHTDWINQARERRKLYEAAKNKSIPCWLLIESEKNIPNNAFRTGTDTRTGKPLYSVRSWYNDAGLLVGKCGRHIPGAHIPLDSKEIPGITHFEILVGDPSCFRWVAVPKKHADQAAIAPSPFLGVEAGFENTHRDRATFIAQIRHKISLQPGKAHSGDLFAFAGYDGKEWLQDAIRVLAWAD